MTLSRRSFFASLSAGAALLGPGALAAAAAPGGPADLGDWAAVRRLFDLDPEYAHLALFFLASHPRPVREAVEAHRQRLDRNPVETVERATFGKQEENLPRQA